MSDDDECGSDGHVHFVTPQDLHRLQQEAMDAHRMQSEEFALATKSLCFETSEDHLRTMLRILSHIADAQDPHALANYFQGLLAGALGAREWHAEKDKPVTIPDGFESVAEERFGRHEFVPAFSGSEVCSTCGTAPANAAHRES